MDLQTAAWFKKESNRLYCLKSKLCIIRGGLQRLAKFIASAGFPVLWSAKAKRKKEKQRQLFNRFDQPCKKSTVNYLPSILGAGPLFLCLLVKEAVHG